MLKDVVMWRVKEFGPNVYFGQVPNYRGIKTVLKDFKSLERIGEGHYLIFRGTKKNVSRLLQTVRTLVKKGGISGQISSVSAVDLFLDGMPKRAAKMRAKARLNRLAHIGGLVEEELRPGYYSPIMYGNLAPEISYNFIRDGWEVLGSYRFDSKDTPVINFYKDTK